MYIIVAGGGVVGRNLIKRLAEKHDVVLIDLDRDICERVYSSYGAISICGNSTNINVLREAGIEKCDVVVSVMRNDADNLAFSLLAKNYGVEQIMVRMRDPEYKSAYRMAGATTIAGIVDMMVEDFVLDIEQPDVRKLFALSGGKAEISILTLPKGSWCHGKTISELVRTEGFPDNILIAGLYNEEDDLFTIPKGDTIIKELNQLFLVGAADNITKAAKMLR
ncbi:potassium channel family protein [Halonatronum saccharophilum]|uniref:potassium channel family protein n=1 Tax=Halonatronum saccharophilum TaxID=150060 RepID=UPI000481E26F|nr:TrkA family potassium uptake protein [Halonatronum saccharophilum]